MFCPLWNFSSLDALPDIAVICAKMILQEAYEVSFWGSANLYISDARTRTKISRSKSLNVSALIAVVISTKNCGDKSDLEGTLVEYAQFETVFYEGSLSN